MSVCACDVVEAHCCNIIMRWGQTEEHQKMVARPGLSPVKVSSALCGVGRVNSHVCGGYCTCVWRAVYMCVVACMYIRYVA